MLKISKLPKVTDNYFHIDGMMMMIIMMMMMMMMKIMMMIMMMSALH